MGNIFKKAFNGISLFLKNKAFFSKMKPVLKNGWYDTKGNSFFKIENVTGKDRNISSCFYIKSRKKYSKTYDCGTRLKKNNKLLFFFDDSVTYYFKNGKTFKRVMDRISDYYAELPYPTMAVDFIADKKIMVGEKVVGEHYFDKEHSDLVIDFLLNAYIKAEISDFQITFREGLASQETYTVYKCVQHTDFHDLNLVWQGSSFKMIDPDGVAETFMFYDLIYYLVQYKNSDLNKYLIDFDLQEKLKAVLQKRGLNCYDNCLDVYIACFITHKINSVKAAYRQIRKKGLKDRWLNWHMGWAANFDFADYPLSGAVFSNYQKTLIKYKLQ